MAAKKKPKRKTNASRIDIDMALLGKLAAAGCTIVEIASMLRRSGLEVSSKTIQRRLQEPAYREFWEDGQNALNVLIRSTMVAQSRMMNGPGVHQAQFLAINRLGMSNKIEHSGSIDSHIEIDSARDRLTRKLATISQRITSGNTRIAAKTAEALLTNADGTRNGET